jgi:hypothetical protein
MKKEILNHTTVKVDNLFPNIIAYKKLDLSKLKVVGNNFKKTFESNVKTTLETETLFDKDSINYLNINLTDLLSYLLKPICKTFVFKVTGIWINKYENKDYQGTHVHPGDFSFIIYYKGNSNTVFNSPVKDSLEINQSKIFNTTYQSTLTEGDIVLFPSYLQHWVKPNSNSITVSGNITVVKH